MKNPFKESDSPARQEPKQSLSDLQFVASLQHEIDELKSIINYLVFNIYVNQSHCDTPEVDTSMANQYCNIDDFIRFIHEKHPEILDEFRRNI